MGVQAEGRKKFRLQTQGRFRHQRHTRWERAWPRVSAVLVREATGVAEPQQNGESGGGLFKAEDRKFALAAESPYQFDYSVKGHLGSQLPAH